MPAVCGTFRGIGIPCGDGKNHRPHGDNLRHAVALALLTLIAATPAAADPPAGTVAGTPAPPLSIDWQKNYLEIRGEHLPGGPLRIHYLEAYCRPGSTDRDWRETVIPHRTQRIGSHDDGTSIQLRCRLDDGVVVDHQITAMGDEVRFALVARNPTERASQAWWAQPCIRVDRFTGKGQHDYLPHCFLMLDGRPAHLPTEPWATEARYVPGQVWSPRGVDRDNVNPRPLSTRIPSHGLIGCYSADRQWILATAWQPYQELFQGVIVCLHSDFRIGGLMPGEIKRVRGKIYIVPADIEAVVKRYERDFPEQLDDGRETP